MATIYKLNFSNGEFYIGQTSQPLEKRVYQHRVTKSSRCPLLHAAWLNQEFTGCEILEDNLSDDEANEQEVYWIRKLSPTLNTLPGGKVLRGFNHPRAKYTREQIEQVADLYLHSELSYKMISDVTGVEYGTVHDIIKQRSQLWVWENEDPGFIAQVAQMRKQTYTFYDADNNQYHTKTSINSLELELGLAPGTLNRVQTGTKSTKGWATEPHPVLELTDPQQEQFILTQPRAKQFIKSFEELSKYQQDQLTLHFKNSADWKVKVLS